MPLLLNRVELVRHSPAVEKTAPSAARKKVSFFPNVSVQEIPHIVDLDIDEIEATWYTKAEYKAVKQSVASILRLMINGGLTNNEEEECTRGLEHRTPEGAMKRKANKLNAFQVVYEAQESQWEDNKHDPDAISILYQMQTYKSRERCIKLGIHDAMVARDENPTTEIIEEQMKKLLRQ